MSLFCILAAGKGQRIQSLFGQLHKALIPVRGKPAVGYLIEKYLGQEFVIAIGHEGERVKEFLLAAYPNQKITFVNVEKSDGIGSGPGRSLLECKKYLNRPFYLFCVDSLFDENLPTEGNWVGVGEKIEFVPANRYCLVKETESGLSFFDKTSNEVTDSYPFCGIARIEDHQNFFDALESGSAIAGELQISSGLEGIKAKSRLHPMPSWIDIGNVESFQAFEAKEQIVPFRKFNQAVYFIDNKVFKYSTDEKEIKKKIERQKILANVSPRIERYGRNFYSYTYVDGVTLEEDCNPNRFSDFLSFCQKKLWKFAPTTPADWQKNLTDFYQHRTLKRWRDVSILDGGLRSEVNQYLTTLDWDTFSKKALCSHFHGDLTLGNVIWNPSGFYLIDYRADFSENLEWGDLYYDFAKLLASMLYSFNKLSAPNWRPSVRSEEVRVLRKYFQEASLDWEHLESILPIVFLNMACLSPEPARERLFFICREFMQKSKRSLGQQGIENYASY